MKRKRKKLHTKGNMIIFPGTMERLLSQAEDALQAENFQEAVRFCEQLLDIVPDAPELPGLLAAALYETKEFERAKPYAAQWIHSDLADYFEAMELYLAICIQLQDYDEVEEIISALLEEDVVPPDLQQKFIYLQELNGRLARRFSEEPAELEDGLPSLQDFLQMTGPVQQQFLTKLEAHVPENAGPLLSEIAGSTAVPDMMRTFALVLLRKLGWQETVVVVKFSRGVSVIPAEIPLPGEDAVTVEVLRLLGRLLDKDPTRLQLIEEAVRKFAIVSYPVGWGASADRVADAYASYASFLFEGAQYPQTALHRLILGVDQDAGQAVE
ncbi:tetratricopeptide repeat protein [Sporosarcina koreensis]|uniref:tetratricopeptide repeat protein n=1 Tax=Sporosarcina koreensis TaxID=334735 RepID=UPI000590E7AF|nr:tetratricopeptide repeat protein [Sporosarcina koreensis]